MKNAKKILALLLCAVMLVGASVAGTLAYLTQKTETVQNTFTVGKVSLGEDEDGDGTVEGGLDEADVNEYGERLYKNGDSLVTEENLPAGAEKTDADRVTANEYKLIPGHTYVKDPTIHVAAGSEEAYLFVTVENGITAIEAEGNTSIAAQMKAKGWENLSGNIYYLNRTVSTVDATEATDVPVFNSFTLADNADFKKVTDNDGKLLDTAKITIIAYAVQADGFNSAAAAWAATFGA